MAQTLTPSPASPSQRSAPASPSQRSPSPSSAPASLTPSQYLAAWQWLRATHHRLDSEWRRFSYINILRAWLASPPTLSLSPPSAASPSSASPPPSSRPSITPFLTQIYDHCGRGGHALLPDPAFDPEPALALLHCLLMITHRLPVRRVSHTELRRAYRLTYDKPRGRPRQPRI